MNKFCKDYGIELPIIQAGMVWCSGWKLASAVSNAGGLGVIGAGSMDADLLRHHIKQMKENCDKPFAVNLPLIYKHIDLQINVIIEEGVPIVITSAGSAGTYTSLFKENNIKVFHVVSSLQFALKAQLAGVDAVIAEGVEAGGHNGKEETTSICLWQVLQGKLTIPYIAAGGIGNGYSIIAALALGASGVQIGSLFACSEESSAHINYKKEIINAKEGNTVLAMKYHNPVRLLKNQFYYDLIELEKHKSKDELIEFAKNKSKLAIFEGDVLNGKIEIGQISSEINSILKVSEIIFNLKAEMKQSINIISGLFNI